MKNLFGENGDRDQLESLDIKEVVGGNIRTMRMIENMSIEEFSLRLNLPLSRVQEIENGREDIHLELLFEIADILNVPLGKLVEESSVLM